MANWTSFSAFVRLASTFANTAVIWTAATRTSGSGTAELCGGTTQEASPRPRPIRPPNSRRLTPGWPMTLPSKHRCDVPTAGWPLAYHVGQPSTSGFEPPTPFRRVVTPSRKQFKLTRCLLSCTLFRPREPREALFVSQRCYRLDARRVSRRPPTREQHRQGQDRGSRREDPRIGCFDA